MRERIAGLVVAAALLAPAAAAAQEAFSHQVQYSHENQFGLHAQSGVGYRFIAPYNEEFCGQVSSDNPGDAKDVCTGRSPLFIDVGASFGVAQSLELFVELRLGLEEDFGVNLDAAGPRQVAFSPGLKLYIRDAGLTKFFSSFQLVIDSTGYDQADKTDYGVRNTNGLQFDFHRTFGVFFFFGETVAFNRWFRFEMDAGIGVQARVP